MESVFSPVTPPFSLCRTALEQKEAGKVFSMGSLTLELILPHTHTHTRVCTWCGIAQICQSKVHAVRPKCIPKEGVDGRLEELDCYVFCKRVLLYLSLMYLLVECIVQFGLSVEVNYTSGTQSMRWAPFYIVCQSKSLAFVGIVHSMRAVCLGVLLCGWSQALGCTDWFARLYVVIGGSCMLILTLLLPGKEADKSMGAGQENRGKEVQQLIVRDWIDCSVCRELH